MKSLLCIMMFCMSFFSYAAENPTPLSQTTRTKDLGCTGSDIFKSDVIKSPLTVRRSKADSDKFNERFCKEENVLRLHLNRSKEQDSKK